MELRIACIGPGAEIFIISAIAASSLALAGSAAAVLGASAANAVRAAKIARQRNGRNRWTGSGIVRASVTS
jgi:hypothetical protein